MNIDIKRYAKYLLYLVAILCFLLIFIFYVFLYPLKYKIQIIEASEKYQLPTHLIASIVLTESSFDKNAISKKGAVGLMQILPSTAKWVCELKGDKYDQEKLNEVSYNLDIGCYYLKYLINKFESVDTAIVAYNAGEGNVSSWLKNQSLSSDGVTLISIPYKESNNYLKKVKQTQKIYKDRF